MSNTDLGPDEALRPETDNCKAERRHPGGKLLQEGANALSEAELLAILISSGNRQKSAEAIAVELVERFQSLRGLADQSLDELTKIEGLGQVKVCRIAAAFEIARRVVSQILAEQTRLTKEASDAQAKDQQPV